MPLLSSNAASLRKLGHQSFGAKILARGLERNGSGDLVKIDHHHGLAKMFHIPQFMRYRDQMNSEALLYFTEFLAHALAHAKVQGSKRFVHQKQLGLGVSAIKRRSGRQTFIDLSVGPQQISAIR